MVFIIEVPAGSTSYDGSSASWNFETCNVLVVLTIVLLANSASVPPVYITAWSLPLNPK